MKIHTSNTSDLILELAAYIDKIESEVFNLNSQLSFLDNSENSGESWVISEIQEIEQTRDDIEDSKNIAERAIASLEEAIELIESLPEIP